MTSNDSPKISVIIPARNAEKYIKLALDSILNQTYPYFEIIIGDDDSSDRTRELIFSYNDPRIKYFKNDSRCGVGATLNKTLKLCSGRYIARLDADDICFSQRLEKQVAVLEKHKDVGMTLSLIQYINEEGNNIDLSKQAQISLFSTPLIRWTLPRNNCIIHSTVMIRKELIMDYLYEEKIFAEDYELWLRMSRDGVKFMRINEPLLKYRLHQGSITNISFKASGTHIFRLIEAKSCFLKKSLRERKINIFVLIVALFTFKDALLYFIRDLIRIFWKEFDR